MSTSMKTTTHLGTRTTRILLLILILLFSLPVVFANTVERSFSTQTVQPQTEITVTLTIDVTEAQFYSWQETVPAGWTIVRTSRGQIAGRTIADVVFGGVQDTTAEYVVRSPDALGPHAFRGTYMFSGMAQEVPIAGPDTVTVQARLGGAGAPCGVDADCGADNLFCVDFVCDSSLCTDTDGENSPIVAGVATLDNEVAVDVVKKDECFNPSQTNEWYCLSPEGGLANLHVPCPEGTTCQPNAEGIGVCRAAPPPPPPPPGGGLGTLDQACRRAEPKCDVNLVCNLDNICEEAPPPAEHCTDSDNGDTPAVQGTTHARGGPGAEFIDFTDRCDGNVLTEFACGADDILSEFTHDCSAEGKICQNGACVLEEAGEVHLGGGALTCNDPCVPELVNACRQFVEDEAQRPQLVPCVMSALGRADAPVVCRLDPACATLFREAELCNVLEAGAKQTCLNEVQTRHAAIAGTCGSQLTDLTYCLISQGFNAGGLGQACLDNRCLEGFGCDAQEICRKQCENSDVCDVAGGESCREGLCVVPPPPVGILGRVCRDAEPKCDVGLVCNAENVCEEAPPEEPIPKQEGEACGPGDVCREGLGCYGDICQTSSCTDTDEADDPAVPGVATLDNSVSDDIVHNDACVEGQNQVTQFSCDAFGGISESTVACPPDTTCQPNAEGIGVCQGGEPVVGPALVCLDPDGFDTSIRSVTFMGDHEFADQCISDDTLLEGTCNADGNDIVDVRVLCPNGCEGGGCRIAPPDGDLGTLGQSCRDADPKCDVGLVCNLDNICEEVGGPPGAGGGAGSLSCEDPCVPQLLESCRNLVEPEETREQLVPCVMDAMIRAEAPVQCTLADGCLNAIREGRACEALPEAERQACTAEVNTRHAALLGTCGSQLTDLTYCLISQGFNAGGLGQACLDNRCLEGFGCDAQEICRKQCENSDVCDVAGGESCIEGLCVIPPPPVGILGTACRDADPKCDADLVCDPENICSTPPPVCEDNDGFNLAEAGEVHIGNFSFVDVCLDENNLLEAVCTPENDDVLDVRAVCEHGCAEGICLQPVPCTDTDGGEDDQIYRVGNVLDAEGTILARDACAPDALTLREGMCVNGTMQVADITCDEMCFANACTRPPPPREEREDEEDEVEPQEDGGEEGGEERRGGSGGSRDDNSGRSAGDRGRSSGGDDGGGGRGRQRYAGYAPGGFPGCGDRYCDSRFGENVVTCSADCAVPGQAPLVPPVAPPGPSLPQVGVGGPPSRPLSEPTPPPPQQLRYGDTGPSLAELQIPEAQRGAEFDVGEAYVPEEIHGITKMDIASYIFLGLALLVLIGGGTAGYFVYARSHAKFEKLRQYVEYYNKQGYTKTAMQQHLQNYGVTPDYLDKLYGALEKQQAKQTGALGAPVTSSAEQSFGEKMSGAWQSFKFKMQDTWESIMSKFRKKET
ncbi:TPA: hypothetical protein HA249_03125 [Candidatus Woesearchaeota archaeon]|nr:hypothetical protein [Candidatus Woesearchaeota archaeon]